jgi:hypothetical protein
MVEKEIEKVPFTLLFFQDMKYTESNITREKRELGRK